MRNSPGHSWPELPVVLEHEHYGNTRKSGSWNGETLLRSVEEYHASYLSIHWWPEIEWRENVETIRAVNRRLGYRIVIPELTFPARDRSRPSRSKYRSGPETPESLRLTGICFRPIR